MECVIRNVLCVVCCMLCCCIAFLCAICQAGLVIIINEDIQLFCLCDFQGVERVMFRVASVSCHVRVDI